MTEREPLSTFHFWCQQVLPLVYDDSISYYEVLCKLVAYLNEMINTTNANTADIAALRSDLSIVQKWIDDFEPAVANDIIEKYIARGVYFGLTQSGYLVAYIPQTWRALRFNTTGKDIQIPHVPYGHLVLSY